MKKLPTLALALSLSTFLVACGEENEPEMEEPADVEPEQETENDESSEAEQDSSTVEITIPADLIDPEDKGTEIEEAEEAGVSDVEENEDGSITYTMSKEVHDEMMADLSDEINENIDEIKEDPGYSSIEDVTANDSFTEFTLIVNQEEFEKGFDEFASFGLGVLGSYYQLFDGVESEEYNVKVEVEDVDSGEIFDTIEFPATLGETDEE